MKKLKQKRQKASKAEKMSKKNSVYCDKCSNEFRSEAQLKAHLKTNICIHFCDFCNEHFQQPMDFIKHATQHSTEAHNLRCIYCEYFSTDENDMSAHIRDDHKKLPKFVCKTCHKNFHVYTWFIEHENFHTGLKPFICEYCGRSFVYSRYLAAHRSNMHKVELTGQKDHLVCPICNKEFERKKTYELHVYRHKGTQVICEICGKTLASKQKLKYHIRIHTGYKPFKCAYCVKCFTKKAFLVEHERIHTGERPYTCEHCNKGFSQRSSLVIHIRTHTGERPYVCHLCQKGFIGRAMLNIHFKHCKGFLE